MFSELKEIPILNKTVLLYTKNNVVFLSFKYQFTVTVKFLLV